MQHLTLSEFRQGINPYGIPYASITPGKTVIVDIPIDHDGTCAEVEGVISRDFMYGGCSGLYYSQIQLGRQLTMTDKIEFSKGLHAIYPENIKQVI